MNPDNPRTALRLKHGFTNLGGRTKYRPEYCQKLIDYFDRKHHEDFEEVHTNQKGDTWKTKKTRALPLPLFEKFAASIGVSNKTVLEWCKKHPEFAEAHECAKDMQRWMLLSNGLLGLYDPRITQFIGVNCCGLKSRKSEVTGTDDRPIVPQIIVFNGGKGGTKRQGTG